MASYLGLHHVALTVPLARLEEARRFYSDVLGMAEMPRPDDALEVPGIWYRMGDAELHIRCGEKDRRDRTGNHIAIIADGVDGLHGRLEAQGVEVTELSLLLGRERFYARDPFGHRIEFTSPP